MSLKRYDRQIALPQIGLSGQQKLAGAKVLVVGAGGLGCPVLQNLAGAGVGYIGICDGDVVAESNLHRQFLYVNADCGKNKAIVAAEAISRQNPEVDVTSYPDYFTTENAFEFLSDYQIVVDCTDNQPVRYLINDVSLAKEIPMVYASIHKFEGQLSVFNFKRGPSYRCLFPLSESLHENANCEDLGVMGVLPNTLGTLQATETLKIILGIGKVLSGSLVVYDALAQSTQSIRLHRNETQIAIGIQNGNSIRKRSDIEVRNITIADFLEAITQKTHLIIDIRETHEEPKLTFETIATVPVSQLEAYIESHDKSQKILLFCQHGHNSILAANYLLKIGFTDVSQLRNGIASLEKINTFE